MTPILRRSSVTLAVLGVGAAMIWQGVTANGSPDPTAEGISPATAVFQTAVIVFREGLEAILVLAALTASLVRTQQSYWKPIAYGAGLSFLASVATWYIVVALITNINAPALHIQAATGLLAIAVLLVIMNWFFHKVYWAGWIAYHNRRKHMLLEAAGHSGTTIFGGLATIGFTSVYREGFEVVLFLQSVRLRTDSHVVFAGFLIGLGLTLMVAWLTFVAHNRLPYRKMLVLTGILLGGVLIVMVGESVQEMQLAGWCAATAINIPMPGWLNLWLAVFPTRESLAAQFLAVLFVLGSYFVARRMRRRPRRASAAEVVPTS